MFTAFVNMSFENKRFINGWTFASSTFGITGDVSRNSWVGDAFTLKSPATALIIHVFPAPAPILFSSIASIIRWFVFALRSYAVVVETKCQIERTSYYRQALEKFLWSFSLI